jgi:pilus assembly protein Flp/PilA
LTWKITRKFFLSLESRPNRFWLVPPVERQTSGIKIMFSLLRRFARNRAGAAAIEYGLIVCMVAVAIVAAAANSGNKLACTFNEVASNLAEQSNRGCDHFSQIAEQPPS